MIIESWQAGGVDIPMLRSMTHELDFGIGAFLAKTASKVGDAGETKEP